jgi:hypothetical protein
MGKEPVPPPIRIQDIINTFSNSIRASIDTILQVDSRILNDTSPKDFILRYCTSPLKTFEIELTEGYSIENLKALVEKIIWRWEKGPKLKVKGCEH